ncbi:hypothetical protein MMC28_009480 [Mycoblastus sanguinarius]|nr:hypothetical protein [Mycoblastus sanguinarius]
MRLSQTNQPLAQALLLVTTSFMVLTNPAQAQQIDLEITEPGSAFAAFADQLHSINIPDYLSQIYRSRQQDLNLFVSLPGTWLREEIELQTKVIDLSRKAAQPLLSLPTSTSPCERLEVLEAQRDQALDDYREANSVRLDVVSRLALHRDAYFGYESDPEELWDDECQGRRAKSSALRLLEKGWEVEAQEVEKTDKALFKLKWDLVDRTVEAFGECLWYKSRREIEGQKNSEL